MKVPVTELEEMIGKFNDMCLSQTEGEPIMLRPFEALLDGHDQAVKFLGVKIWDSDEDYRQQDDHGNHEPLASYIRREAESLYKSIKALDL